MSFLQVFYEEGQSVWSRACATVEARNSNLEVYIQHFRRLPFHL
jgi:hypothetical protein